MATARKKKNMKKIEDYTRADAEKALSKGEDPSFFTGHPNYHVKLKAWKKMGRPLPEGQEDADKLLLSFQGQDPKDMDKEAVEALVTKLRGKLLPIA